MKKILIIEDEENIRELISFNLNSEGYEVVACDNGKSGLEAALEDEFSLILLDLMLPELDGYEVIKELRGKGNETPVIMLTAKNEEIDKILGLEFGADDYITKPFSVRELKARIKAVLRRYEKGSVAAASGKSAPSEVDEELIIGDLRINIPAHEVYVNNKKIELSLKEYELLRTLAENRGHVITRDQLLDKVWGYEYYGETRTVDVHIRYLRKKLGEDESKYIETIRGVGYKIT